MNKEFWEINKFSAIAIAISLAGLTASLLEDYRLAGSLYLTSIPVYLYSIWHKAKIYRSNRE